jgi:hypothetical protein
VSGTEDGALAVMERRGTMNFLKSLAQAFGGGSRPDADPGLYYYVVK